MDPQQTDTRVETLGPRNVKSPLTLTTVFGDGLGNFTRDEARVHGRVETGTGNDNPDIQFESAGPREHIFFDPAHTRAAIVTCGGLCPGLNTVIRSAFLELFHNYGVKNVQGIRFGYEGLNPASAAPPITLTAELVDDIHKEGGTILGSSRGQQPVPVMVDYLEKQNIDILLCVGGDGTQHGSHEIAKEIRRRGLKKVVVGIPKTIDNDICFVRQTFGYFTAIEVARNVLDCAHNEAKGAPNGIGLVKVMGRDSGFIAAGATLASQEVNFCLIPELPFVLDGKNGLLNVLRERILNRQHAVIVVAEGAGQNLMPDEKTECDASGNKKHKDIGIFLREAITRHFASEGIPVN
ncbi:MAG: ATP-dependent 6-phosphofructokinase, partial [Lentisphaerota bacterium]